MEIRTLGPDEKITEPGFYSISLDRHHSQPCDGISVTSGVLRRMMLETPSKVWACHKLNPDPWPSEDVLALRLGRAIAAMIEGGEVELMRHFMVVRPDDPNKPTEAQRNAHNEGRATDKALASIDFWRRVEESGKDVIKGADLEMIQNMFKALSRDPAAMEVLGGIPEITMAHYDERNDLWLLARPDNIRFDGLISDYKKISTGGRPFTRFVCDRRITDYGYGMQIAFAAEAFEALTGNWPSLAGLVFQEDKAPFDCIVREISEEDLRMDQWRNHFAQRRFRECYDSGDWPGPGVDIGAYQRPDWERERILEAMNSEGVAP